MKNRITSLRELLHFWMYITKTFGVLILYDEQWNCTNMTWKVLHKYNHHGMCADKSNFQTSVVKPKPTSLANQKGRRKSSEPIKTRSNYKKLTRSAGKVYKRVTTGSGCPVIGWKSGASFLSQSCNVAMQNQLLLNTQVNTAPSISVFLVKLFAKRT